MKTKHILLTIICLGMFSTAEAQFLKKLKQKAAEAAERTILNKTDEEVSKKTEKTIDDITEGNEESESNEKLDNRGFNILGSSLDGLPETYNFSYTVDMQIISNKDDNSIQYYVEPDANYFSIVVPQNKTNSIVVYDMENQAMVTFMDNDGNKMAMKMRIPLSDEKIQTIMKKESDEAIEKWKNLDITPLPDKTILGYACKGYQIPQDDSISKIWFTNEAPVNFVGMFASAKNMPENIGGNMIPLGPKSMMLEMEYTSNKQKKDNMRMVCTGIHKKSMTISRKDYKAGM